ncbi:IS5 family transposase [Streptomyces azureus]|uniref:Transposase n=1 Tax=Streptomyces azureus TaxID=146537 RepID=A0A0K8PWA0_STRAJ|nr:IS5 family transposase [Streptomyces azureus]GAP52220.1 transposase [Streptomyces azureus]
MAVALRMLHLRRRHRPPEQYPQLVRYQPLNQVCHVRINARSSYRKWFLELLLAQCERRFGYPGRKPLPDRDVLCGILCVLHTGIQWEYLPKQLGFGSGMTCWRRLRDWNEAGVWQRLYEVLLAELNAAAKLDWSRCVVDSWHVRVLKGGSTRAPRRSTGAGRLGTSSDHRRHGTPIAVLLTGGNRNGVTQLLPLLDVIPPVRGPAGRPRRKPDSLFADRGYDHDLY